MKPTLKIRALLFCGTLTAAPCLIAATNYTNTSADDWTNAVNLNTSWQFPVRLAASAR